MPRSLLLVALVAGCSGDGLTRLVDLTSSQEMDLCSDEAERFPQHAILCTTMTSMQMTTIGRDEQECVNLLEMQKAQTPSCPATYAQTEACTDALASEPDDFWCAELMGGVVIQPDQCAPLDVPACVPNGAVD